MAKEGELYTRQPYIFTGLPVAYGETHRVKNSSDPLSGNTSHSQALSKVYRWLDTTPELPEAEWVQRERERANQRIAALYRALTGRAQAAVALTLPEHGTRLADTDILPEKFTYTLPPAARVRADATITRQNKGLLFNPADCPIINLAYYQAGEVGAIAQIHAGAAGLAINVIGKTIKNVSQLGFKPHAALAYISPHSRQYTLHGPPLEQLQQHGLGSYTAPASMRGAQPEQLFDMTSLSIDQLTDAGVLVNCIEVSPIDTMADARYYSQRRQSRQAAGTQRYNPDLSPFGRNAIMLTKNS